MTNSHPVIIENIPVEIEEAAAIDGCTRRQILVVVALPSKLQPGVTADLLRRGLRVLVERPIGSSSANAAALGEIENVESALMVGYTLHHHPVEKVLAEWVASATVISISIRSAVQSRQSTGGGRQLMRAGSRW